MASVVKFEKRPTLTPELREFIDGCLVPILVRDALAELAREKSIAEIPRSARHSAPTAQRSASEEQIA